VGASVREHTDALHPIPELLRPEPDRAPRPEGGVAKTGSSERRDGFLPARLSPRRAATAVHRLAEGFLSKRRKSALLVTASALERIGPRVVDSNSGMARRNRTLVKPASAIPPLGGVKLRIAHSAIGQRSEGCFIPDAGRHHLGLAPAHTMHLITCGPRGLSHDIENSSFRESSSKGS